MSLLNLTYFVKNKQLANVISLKLFYISLMKKNLKIINGMVVVVEQLFFNPHYFIYGVC